MKVQMVVSCLALCVGLSLSADVVTNDYFADVTSPTTLRGVTNVIAKCQDARVAADLTLDDRTYIWLRGEKASSPAWLNLAPTTNGVTLTVQGNSGIFTAYRYSMNDSSSDWYKAGVEPASAGTGIPDAYYYARMGVVDGEPDSTGPAKIVLNTTPAFGANLFSGFMAKKLDVETSVSPDPGTGFIDILEIASGVMADIAQINVKATAHPARILFKGGTLLRNNATANVEGKAASPLAPAAGATLVLQGVDGADIRLRTQFAQTDITGRKGGAVRIVGKDVYLDQKGNTPLGRSGHNHHPWRLDQEDHVTWENTGDLIFIENVYLRTTSDDLLPHGPQTGSLAMEGNRGVSATTAAAGTSIPYCCLDLCGTRQYLNGVTSRRTEEHLRAVVTNTHETATGTLVLGEGDVSGTLNARCTANVTVEKTGAGLLSVRSATGETLGVSAGAVTFSDSTFTNVTAAAGTTLSGAVTVTGAFTASGATPPSAAGLNLSLSADATVAVAGTTPLVVYTLTVNGTAAEKGAYTPATASWLKEGSVTVLWRTGDAVADVTWTGAGATVAASDAGNWDAAPDFSTLGTRPVFASGGAVAQLDGVCNFSGIKFSAADGFTLAAADGSAGTANLYGDIAFAAVDGARRTYEVTAPLTLVTDQTIELATNATLKLTGGLSGSAGLEMTGAKLSEKIYDYDVSGGELVLENARITGPISHTKGGWLVLRGDVGCPGDTSTLALNYARARDGENWQADSLLTGLTRLDGATVYKPVRIDGLGVVLSGADRWLIAETNTVNTFKEAVTCGTSMAFRAGDGAKVVFEKGITVENGGLSLATIDDKATDSEYVLEGPVLMYSINRALSCNATKRVVFRSTGNYVKFFVQPWYATLAFEIDDAFTDTGFFFTQTTGGEIDLGTTHQQMTWLGSGWVASDNATNDVSLGQWQRGTVRGAWPATLEVTPGVADGAQSVTNCGAQFTGWVTLAKSGSGVHRMLPRAYESYGDVEVSGGRLEFDAGATWRNGTNVTVRGTGTLKVGSAQTFRKDVRVVASGEDWVIDLTGMQKAASLTVDGVAMPAGDYDSGHATLGRHFTGTGVLRVGKLGGCLIIR